MRPRGKGGGSGWDLEVLESGEDWYQLLPRHVPHLQPPKNNFVNFCHCSKSLTLFFVAFNFWQGRTGRTSATGSRQSFMKMGYNSVCATPPPISSRCVQHLLEHSLLPQVQHTFSAFHALGQFRLRHPPPIWAQVSGEVFSDFITVSEQLHEHCYRCTRSALHALGRCRRRPHE